MIVPGVSTHAVRLNRIVINCPFSEGLCPCRRDCPTDPQRVVLQRSAEE